MSSSRGYWCRLVLGLLLLTSKPAVAQLDPILPDIQSGDVEVRLRAIATGIPVEQEFVTPVFVQRVGPTDFEAIPGRGGAAVVTAYGGGAFYINEAGQRNDEPFLELANPSSPSFSPEFEIGDAHGLTSIAFHPGFADPAHPGYLRFYTLEAETANAGVPDFDDSFIPGNHHQEALYEYRLSSVDAQRCDDSCVATKREVLRVNQASWHHNLGDLLFNSDETLFVSSADSGVAGTTPPIRSDHSLDLATVYGKILRLDPLGNDSVNGEYGIPSDNPFVDGDGTNVDEIYAYGLRNPYRLALNQETGQLYSIETGENNIESIEAISSGSNHGWNEKEGSWIYDKLTRGVSPDIDANGNGIGDLAEERGYTEPLFEYGRQDGIAVTGVAPVEDRFLPELSDRIVLSDFQGKLFYGDPTTGQLLSLAVDSTTGPTLPFRIHSVNRDLDGSIYVLGIQRIRAGEYDGVVYRIEAPPALGGDVNGDDAVDVDDIDALARAIREKVERYRFDVNDDGSVDVADHEFWVVDIKGTYLGDANLDGETNSADLVAVFQSNEYEDAIVGNSTWSTGDWNGDGDFTTDDLVHVFQDGSYEIGPRMAIPTPEPSSLLSVVWALAVFVRLHRRKT